MLIDDTRQRLCLPQDSPKMLVTSSALKRFQKRAGGSKKPAKTGSRVAVLAMAIAIALGAALVFLML